MSTHTTVRLRSGIVRAAIAATALAGATAMIMPIVEASAATSTTTIYPSSAKPTSSTGESDSAAVELGVSFVVSTDGAATAIKFYKGTQNLGTHTGSLWTGAGQKLAGVTFSKETASGWQTATLSTPVALKANTPYVASYWAPKGHYSQQQHTFWNGATIGNSTIKATAGTFLYGASGFPTSSWNESSYYVDVVFAPGMKVATTSSTTSVATTSSTNTIASPPATSSASTTSAAPTSSAPTSSAPATTSSTTSAAPSTSSPAPTSSATTTTATASPSPTSTAPSSAIPDETNTGVPAGTTLTAVPGQRTSGTGWHWDGTRVVIDSDNVTLNALDINGAVANTHNGLVIQNSRVRCTNENNWCVEMGAGSTVTDTEIGGGANLTTYLPAIGILSGYWKTAQAANLIQRVHVHHTIHGMRVDGDTTVTDSYIENFPMGEAPYTDAHTDGIMCTAGANVTIRHNHFSSGNNSPFFVQWQTGNALISNYVIENNVIDGIVRNNEMSSWGIAFENKGIGGPVTIRNNTFTGTFQAGAIEAPTGSTVTGNVTSTGSAASVQLV